MLRTAYELIINLQVSKTNVFLIEVLIRVDRIKQRNNNNNNKNQVIFVTESSLKVIDP